MNVRIHGARRHTEGPAAPLQRSYLLKRPLDLLTATAAILLLLPVFLVIAAVVRLDSRGPVLYRGRRTGQHKRVFEILKFRTMIPGAERAGGTSTGFNDHRVTKAGKYLRRYKLDELPQFVNVLRGEMSIVGPRPEVEEYTRQYNTEEEAILTVRPGLTDFASIRFIDLAGSLGSESPDEVYARTVRPEKNRLRLEYVRRQSLGTDARIVWRTLWVLATHRRA